MPSFSQRKGLKPVKSVLQLDSMDLDLRNGIWNALTDTYFHRIAAKTDRLGYLLDNEEGQLVKQIWTLYFKTTADSLDGSWSTNQKTLRKYFFECPWNE